MIGNNGKFGKCHLIGDSCQLQRTVVPVGGLSIMKTRPGSCSNVGNVVNSGSVGNSGNAGMVSGNTSPAVVACNRSRRRPLPSTPTPQPSTLDCQTPPPSDRVII